MSQTTERTQKDIKPSESDSIRQSSTFVGQRASTGLQLNQQQLMFSHSQLEPTQSPASSKASPIFSDQRASTAVQLKQQHMINSSNVTNNFFNVNKPIVQENIRSDMTTSSDEKSVAPVQMTVIEKTADYTDKSGRAGVSKLSYICDGYDYKKQNEPADSTTSNMPMRDEIATTYLKTHVNDPFAMHLVNGRLGGRGDDKRNLAWGSSELNRQHFNGWEADRQTEVQSQSGQRVDVKVEAFYHSDNLNEAAGHYLRRLECQHTIDGEAQSTVPIEVGLPVEQDGDWTPQPKRRSNKNKKRVIADLTKPSKKHSGIKRKNSTKIKRKESKNKKRRLDNIIKSVKK